MRGWRDIPGIVWMRALSAGIAVLLPVSAASGGEGEMKPLWDAVALRPGEAVFGLAGYDGEPVSGRWFVLIGRPGSNEGWREVSVTDGKAGASRVFQALPEEDPPHLPIDPATLRRAASDARVIAGARGAAAGIRWTDVHFHLRVRDEDSEPVWLVTFINRARVMVGHVYLSARTGEILRESWPRTEDGSPSGRLIDPGKVSAR